MSDPNVTEACAVLIQREAKGLAEYGVSTDRRDYTLLMWLYELRAETADTLVYATRMIREMEGRL